MNCSLMLMSVLGGRTKPQTGSSSMKASLHKGFANLEFPNLFRQTKTHKNFSLLSQTLCFLGWVGCQSSIKKTRWRHTHSFWLMPSIRPYPSTCSKCLAVPQKWTTQQRTPNDIEFHLPVFQNSTKTTKLNLSGWWIKTPLARPLYKMICPGTYSSC